MNQKSTMPWEYWSMSLQLKYFLDQLLFPRSQNFGSFNSQLFNPQSLRIILIYKNDLGKANASCFCFLFLPEYVIRDAGEQQGEKMG